MKIHLACDDFKDFFLVPMELSEATVKFQEPRTGL